MLIIPSIDIYKGRVVRLKKGDYNEVTIYNDSPLNQAIEFEQNGIKRIHIVDLEGSKEGRFFIEDTLKEITKKTKLQIQVGGGIRSLINVEQLDKCGVKYFVIGSLSVIDKEKFEEIVNETGAERIIVASDVKDNMIAVKGWTETTSTNLFDHIEYCMSLGITQFLCTDISRDGLLKGTNVSLYSELKKKYKDIFVIASGGLASYEEINELKKNNIDAAVLGKAYYEGLINLKEIVNA